VPAGAERVVDRPAVMLRHQSNQPAAVQLRIHCKVDPDEDDQRDAAERTDRRGSHIHDAPPGHLALLRIVQHLEE